MALSLGSTPDFSHDPAAQRPHGGLLEREAELRELDLLLDGVIAARGGLLVLDGVAGVGKSRLLEAAVERAAARGVDVRRVTGDYLERSYAWRGAIELLGEPVLEGPLREGEDAALQRLRAFTRHVADLTGERPLLLVVDDAHWLDTSTLRLVHFLAGRLEGLCAGVLLARRPGETTAPDEALLHAIAAHPSARVLTLSALGGDAVQRLVRSVLGEETSSEFCRRCAELTGGNPYYLQELLRSLPGDPGPPVPEQLEGLAPPTLARSVLMRLSRVGPDAEAVAQALAVLGEDARPHQVASLTDLEVESVLGEADRLTASDLVRVGTGIRFAHPLVRAVVEADMARGARGAGHARAASLLSAEGAQPELVAGHLLLAPPGSVDGASEVLRRAASRAVARGAPGSAVTYLERALEEPMHVAQRAAIRMELAEAAVAAGAPRAAEHLERALEDAPEGAPRARIRLALGWALHAAGQFADSAREFEAGLSDLAGQDERLAVELRTGAMTAGMLTTERAIETHRQLESIATLPKPRDAAERHYQSQLLVLGLFSGLTPAEALAEFAEGQLADLDPGVDEIHDWTRWNLIGTLSWCDRYETAFANLDPLLLRGGATLRVAMASYARSWPSLWTGRIAQAAEDARRAVDLWTAGAETYLPAAAFWLVSALCEMNHVEMATAALRGIDLERWQDTAFFGFALASRGRLAAATGDLQGALENWLACGAFVTEKMQLKNSTLLPWRTEAVMLASRLRDSETADALARDDLELARSFGAPRALGASLRATAMTRGGLEGVKVLEQAAGVLHGSGAALEHAHVLVDLGSALRRSGSRAQAREPLRAGLAAARSFGANALAERATQELIASGARELLRSDDSPLTPSEQRIAELAAEGLTNREIAAQLFVTVKAVEFHLSRVFAKLEISGRRELPHALERR